MSIQDQIIQAIAAVMPPNAEVRPVQGVDALHIGVSWRLNDDPERPNKMSKTIAICVSHEAVEDFAAASAANQNGATQRVRAFLAQRLAQFDPRHNTPKHAVPPVEKWVISSATLVG